MDMVRHQAISSYLHTSLAAPFRHQFQIRIIIFITKKDLLTTIPSLRDVVGDAGDNDSRYTNHPSKVRSEHTTVKK